MKAPFGHWEIQTFIAALRHDGLTAPWVIDAPMNRRLFETYVETQLAPTLGPGDIVILDNLSSHKSEKAKAILKERGAWFLFLPPYSPDLNPIEMAFAKLKAHLRKTQARTIDALWQAVGSICELYSPHECSNYLRHAGYVAEVNTRWCNGTGRRFTACKERWPSRPLILKGTEPRGFPSWPEANLPRSTGRIDSRILCRSDIEKSPCAGGVHRFVPSSL